LDTVEEVKTRLDILDVIAPHVQLKKAGRNYSGLCPFHSEKTPSFFVSQERQSWHCFGACNTGGDIFAFFMRKDGLDFPQALRLLAERAGVPLREREEENKGELQRLIELNEAASQYYHDLLLRDKGASPAREYLEHRGLDTRWVQEFTLGYSSPAWDDLRVNLQGRGYSDEEMLAAGLLVAGDTNPYDRFRGRLMFPIRDVNGKVIGFGARALDDSLPKYLNTLQTAIFDKGGTLYALDRAREAIRKQAQAVIVEGYMDAIAAHQHGFANVVASMGTALTERQVRLLRRYTRNLVLALDADAAGSEAALRGQDVVQETQEGAGVLPVVTWGGLVRYQEVSSVALKVAELPLGSDPDTLIRQEPGAWQALIEHAKSALDHKYDYVGSRTGNTPQSRSEAVRQLMPLISPIVDPVIRAHYLQKLSRLALVKEEVLARMLSPARGGPRKMAGPEAQAPSSTRDNKEEFLLALLLRYPALAEMAPRLRPELLWQSENQEMLAIWRRTGGLAQLHQELPEELRAHVERILSLWDRIPPDWDLDGGKSAFEDCLSRLEHRQMALQKQAETAMLAAEEERVEDKLSSLEVAATMMRGDQEDGDENEASVTAAVYVKDTQSGLELHERIRQGLAEGDIVDGDPKEGPKNQMGAA